MKRRRETEKNAWLAFIAPVLGSLVLCFAFALLVRTTLTAGKPMMKKSSFSVASGSTSQAYFEEEPTDKLPAQPQPQPQRTKAHQQKVSIREEPEGLEPEQTSIEQDGGGDGEGDDDHIGTQRRSRPLRGGLFNFSQRGRAFRRARRRNRAQGNDARGSAGSEN